MFSVGGHWGGGGALGFRRGALQFWADKPSPPPPPPPTKKKSSPKKGPHFPAEQADKQGKTKEKKKVITSVGMGSRVASFFQVFSGLKIHLNTYNQCSSLLLLMAWRYIYDSITNTTHWEKSLNMRASGASELRNFLHFHIRKLLFPSIFCLYLWYFVSVTYIFRSQITSAYTLYNKCSFLLLLLVWHYV